MRLTCVISALLGVCDGRAARAAAQSNADGDDLVLVHKAAMAPDSGERRAVNGDGAPSIRHIGVVVTFEPLACRPLVAAEARPGIALECALEPIDWPSMLEPLESTRVVIAPMDLAATSNELRVRVEAS